MTVTRPALLAAVSTLLFACASTSTTPPAAPKPPEESSAGFWRGTSTRFQADVRNCPHPGLVTLQVWDDRFQYRWDYSTYVDGSIDPDGTVRGQGPNITLLGKRTGKKMDGDVTNGNCGMHFTVTKSDK